MAELPLLTYYDIAEGVKAFSTTRHGGCSKGVYATLNINSFCGDDADNVRQNRAKLLAELGSEVEHIIMPHQTHGTTVRAVESHLAALDNDMVSEQLDGVDALTTNLRGVCIGVSTADCIPVLLYDSVRRAVCAVHAGWRGTVNRIVDNAIRHMTDVYGTQASDLKAVIGPGISLDCFEVGDEVYAEFEAAQFDMKRISCRKNKWHIDLPECNRIQLMEAGVGQRNIKMCGICTYKHADDYFSARRLGTKSGRIFSGICLI